MKKSVRYITIISFTLIFLVFIFLIVLNYNLPDFLQKTIKKNINPPYVLEIKNIDASIFSRDIHCENLKFYSDTIRHETNDKPRVWVDVDHIEVRNFNLLKLLFKRELHIEQIKIDQPGIELSLISPSNANADSSLVKTSGQPFKKVCIEQLNITDGNIRLLQEGNDTLWTSIIENFTIDEITYSPDTIQGFLKQTNFKNIFFRVQDFKHYSSNGFYCISGSELHQENANNLLIKNLNISPLYPKYVFAKEKGHLTTRLEFNCKTIQIKTDLEQIINNDFLLIHSLWADSFHIKAFRNKNIPDSPERYVPPLPQQILRELDQLVHIDSLHLNHGLIEYEEHAKGGSKTGYIKIMKTRAFLSNISNHPDSLAKDDKMKIDFYGWLNGEGYLDAHFVMPILNTNNYFSYYGNISEMDLESFNSILEPCAFLTIKKGKLEKLRFHVQANENSASGKMYMHYHDLNISARKLKKRDIRKESSKDKILSMLINTFFIKSSNPKGKKDLREGIIEFERDHRRSVFHYWIKSILSGVPSSLGIKEEKTKVSKKKKIRWPWKKKKN